MKKIVSIVAALVMALSVILIPIDSKAMSTDEFMIYARVFDADYYYAAYPDVAAAYGQDYGKLLSHFVTNGMYEGRSASYEFNPLYYKAANKDLQAAFGDDMYLYCKHYVENGKKEGRVANSKTAKKVDTSKTHIGVSFNNPQLIASRTTTYNARIPRAINVGLAADSLNGTIVMPGAQFSYNEAVGPRTKARGYVMATVYNSGEVTTGIGGGICQVSSTTYAAMRDCGLPATERHAHSLPVHYLPTGYDATVAYGSLDLKFVNIYQAPLLVRASADNGNLTVDLILLW